MLVWAGCRFVFESAFIDYQEIEPDFATFVSTNLDPTTFIPAEKKDELPLIIPAEFAFDHAVRRSNQNVVAVHMGVLDMDHGNVGEQLAVLNIIKKYGHFVHTSFSHQPDGQHKRRAFLKLSRPVNVTEWASFFPRFLEFFRATDVADKKCSDPCHMYFVPGGDFTKYEAFGADGPGLDVDAVLALPMPEGFEEPKLEGYQDLLPDEERGTVGQGLKDLWEAKLVHLVDAIEKREYPAPIYDLKVHQVFGLARGCPHIMSNERLRNCVVIAMDRRYRKAKFSDDEEMIPVYREKSIEQIEKAIAAGMEQPWWPPKINEIVVRPLTEFGLAERLVDSHSHDIRWEPTWKSWLGWNGKYWNLEAGIEVVRYKMFETIRAVPSELKALEHEYLIAKELYEDTLRDANVDESVRFQAEQRWKRIEEQVGAVNSFALKSETHSRWAHSVMIASTLPKVLTDFRAFNRDPWLVNFKNGTLHLRTGEFYKHRREDFITRMVPYEFDPNAECPVFNIFMREFTCGNKRLENFLWRLIGYTACGVTDEQKIFIMCGDGANGKSTLLTLLLEIFGQGPTGYGLAVNSENLLSSRGSNKHETWRMSLAGMRMVGAQEIDEGRTFAESLIKELTGSDIITGRKMRQDEWSYKPEFTPWLAVNHLPHIRGTDEGIWRRICTIPCTASFKDKPDRDMSRRLLQEASGIWARISKEAREWMREGLVIPREIVAANTLYRHEQDPLRDFIERYCVVEAEASTSRAMLWAAYEDYCTEYKVKVFHERKRFYAAVEKQFVMKKIHGERLFAGLRVKNPKERFESTPRAILARALLDKDKDKPN